jgi:hypothetical protein
MLLAVWIDDDALQATLLGPRLELPQCDAAGAALEKARIRFR